MNKLLQSKPDGFASSLREGAFSQREGFDFHFNLSEPVLALPLGELAPTGD